VFDRRVLVRTAPGGVSRQSDRHRNVVFVLLQTRCAISVVALDQLVAPELRRKGSGGGKHLLGIQSWRQLDVLGQRLWTVLRRRDGLSDGQYTTRGQISFRRYG